MADQEKSGEADDKSINDLLKEYAEDVKDKDLDDFLKDDDAFESEDSDSGEDADEEVVEEPKKSGGILMGLVMLVVFAAAGAGTYVYLNRDEGMTSIMGGFTGGSSPSANDNVVMQTPPQPETEPSLPAPEGLVMKDLPEQPTPISNDAPAPEAAAPDASKGMEPPPASDLLSAKDAPSAPMPEMPAAPAAPAATTSDAATAVDAWTSGEDAAMMPAADLPVAEVEVVKAQPPQAPKEAKKTEPAAAPAPAKTAKKEEGALPPPYIAIQGKDTSSASAPAKMAPVVETREKASRNINEADVTSATGDYRAMVMSGGGKIEVSGSRTTFAPAGSSATAPAPMPEDTTGGYEAPRQLAIGGGKSLPDGYKAHAMAPAKAAMPEEPVEEPAEPVAAPMKAMMKAPAPEMPSVPQASSVSSSNDAKAVLAQAVALEKAGKTGDALELYQRALELDAVYGDGNSIDRGMVYDRIGAIRAGR